MAMTVAKNRDVNIAPYNGAEFTFTGDSGGTQYAATGITHALKGAICIDATDANGPLFEINTQDSTAATNGSIYWHTAVGDGETCTMIVLW